MVFSLQASTPSSPTYVAAVVEYSPHTSSAEDTVADVVSKNAANYVSLIQQASEQVEDTTRVSGNHGELP
jgi:hypothetical protein